jgi:aminomethyltransferase
MQKESKITPLHGRHTALGANMADFGGYEMPLWYSTAKMEHLAVLTNAGIFDTSHMAVIMVAGPEALELLQLCFTNDLAACTGKIKGPLSPGRCVYGAYLNQKGEVIDDSIICQLEENSYMVVVNAGMGDVVAGHFSANQGDRRVEITDLTDKVGKIDVQGPMAAKILSKVLADPENVFKKTPYFSFKGHFDAASSLSDTVRLTDGTPILLSRTGYTGEFGFEIFVSSDHAVKLWDMILDAGRDFEIIPCGLAARDSLRAGAVLPLSHQDIGAWPFINHPWVFALPFNDDQTAFNKTFIGDQALLSIEAPEYTYPFAGGDFRKVSAEDPAVVLDSEGHEIGRVLTCVTDMGIGRQGDRIYSVASPDKPQEFKPKGLCCGFVKVKSRMVPGQNIDIKDNRRKLTATIVNDIRPDRTARRPIVEML